MPTVFCENRNLDVIKEALHNALGYGVTHKYKAYAEELAMAYSSGQNSTAIADLSPASPSSKRVFKNAYL